MNWELSLFASTNVYKILTHILDKKLKDHDVCLNRNSFVVILKDTNLIFKVYQVNSQINILIIDNES